MNVTLAIPAETGTGRTGAQARRTGDGDAQAGDFRALYDAVAQAPATDRQPQPGPLAETAGVSDEADTEGALRRAGERRAGDWGVPGAAQEMTAEAPDADGSGPATAATPQDESEAARPSRQEKDAAADPVKRRDHGRRDKEDGSKDAPADAGTADVTAAATLPPGAARSADPPAGTGRGAHGDAGKANRADDGSAIAASQTEAGGSKSQRRDTGTAAASRSDGEPAKDADRNNRPQGGARQSAAAASPANPQAESGVVRQGHRDASSDVRRADVRVTAYERHLAPLMRSGGAKAAVAADGAVDQSGRFRACRGSGKRAAGRDRTGRSAPRRAEEPVVAASGFG